MNHQDTKNTKFKQEGRISELKKSLCFLSRFSELGVLGVLVVHSFSLLPSCHDLEDYLIIMLSAAMLFGKTNELADIAMRKFRLLLVAAAVLIGIGVSLWALTAKSKISSQSLLNRIRKQGAVLVSDAAIDFDVPSSNSVVGNATLRLFDPVIINDVPNLTGFTVVIGERSGFTGDVGVAIETVKSLGPGANAILPEEVEIIHADRNGIRIISSGSINYIDVKLPRADAPTKFEK